MKPEARVKKRLFVGVSASSWRCLIRAIKKLLYLAQANLLTTPFVDNCVQNDSAGRRRG